MHTEEAAQPLAATALRHLEEGGCAIFVSPSARTGLTEFIAALRAGADERCMSVAEYTMHEFEAQVFVGVALVTPCVGVSTLSLTRTHTNTYTCGRAHTHN